jgi:hypothetical protein
MKNLENFGVQEMNAKEIKETDGGGMIADAVYAFRQWSCTVDWGAVNRGRMRSMK